MNKWGTIAGLLALDFGVVVGSEHASNAATLTLGSGFYTTFLAAYNASSPGDTIQQINSTVTAVPSDVAILHDITLDCQGNTMTGGTITNPGVGNVGKAFFIVGGIYNDPSGPTFTVKNCNFTYANNGGQYNGAAIRGQSGNLYVSKTTFTYMQDAILWAPVITETGTVSIDHSVLSHIGDGLQTEHGIYIDDPVELDYTNNESDNIQLGHHVKTRARINVIEGNTFDATGTSDTSSYALDITLNGSAIVSGNTFISGPSHFSNGLIDFGIDNNPYTFGNLMVTGNLVINNGRSIQLVTSAPIPSNHVFVSGNVIQGSTLLSDIINGVGAQCANILANGSPAPNAAYYTDSLVQGSTTDFTNDFNSHTVTLNGAGIGPTLVQGGNGPLIVNVATQYTVVMGGPGGMTLTNNQLNGTVYTYPGATDTLTMNTGWGAMWLYGNDVVNIGSISIAGGLGGGDAIYVNGKRAHAVITSYGTGFPQLEVRDGFFEFDQLNTISNMQPSIQAKGASGTIVTRGANAIIQTNMGSEMDVYYGTLGARFYGYWTNGVGQNLAAANQQINSVYNPGWGGQNRATITGGSWTIASLGNGYYDFSGAPAQAESVNIQNVGATVIAGPGTTTISVVHGNSGTLPVSPTGDIFLNTGSVVLSINGAYPPNSTTLEVDGTSTGTASVSGYRHGTDTIIAGPGVSITSQITVSNSLTLGFAAGGVNIGTVILQGKTAL